VHLAPDAHHGEHAGQARICEYHTGGGLGHIGGAGHAQFSLAQRRRVVDVVAGHAGDVTSLLQRTHDVVLVLGQDAGVEVAVLGVLRPCTPGLAHAGG
jgi:hypothetical protein